MAKIIQITPTQQYNIDAIKRIRLELNISGNDLSLKISQFANRTLVGSIESPSNNPTYTDAMMNRIAIYFTEIAKEHEAVLNSTPGNTTKIKTEYTIYDFYPEPPLAETLQLKTNSTGLRKEGGTTAINTLLENGYFDTPRSLKEIVAYCNQLGQRTWRGPDFTAPLERAVKTGKLKHSFVEDGSMRYEKN